MVAIKSREYQLLDSVRDRVLAMPVRSKLRVRYRDLRRACHNAGEDARASVYSGHGCTTDFPGILRSIERLVSAVKGGDLIVERE